MSVAEAPTDRRTLRLLVVEDSQRDVELVLATLEEAGYAVSAGRVDIAEAMRAALASGQWDVVIADFSMPRFDAFAAMAVLKESGLDIPCIIVSGTIGEDVAVRCMRAGANDYLLKGNLARLGPAIEREMREAAQRAVRRRQERALEALHELAFAAGGPPDPERLASFAVDRARELLGVDVAALYWWNEAQGVLELLAEREEGRGVRVTRIRPGEGVSGAAFLRRSPVVVDDYAAPPAEVRPPRPGLRGSAVAVPLIVAERVLGTFYVRSLARRPFAADEIRALSLLAAQVAPAIQSSRLFHELRESERRFAHLALFNPLTDLPNRMQLRARLEHCVQSGAASGEPCALVLLDLGNFKAINDAFGHQLGDAILQQVGPRLEAELRQEDLVAHLGADNFAILLPGRDAVAAAAVGARVLRAFDRPFPVGEQRFEVAAAMGIVAFPAHGADADVLLRRADVALHAAKGLDATPVVYGPEHEQHTAERVALVGELRRGLERRELVLHYQPQVDLRRGAVVGYEALMRWRHPSRGLLPPGEFVPLAERTGLARSLFEWALREALRESAPWVAAGARICLGVNLSVRNLLDPELPALVEGALREAHRSPELLTLEITEGVLMANPERAIRVLERLRATGVEVSIDDFGTGYSSMAYVQRLPVDELKIDRSFVAGIPEDRRNVAIVRAIIDLARGLGLRALAEGVEDERTLSALVTLGCDRAQGFRLGAPVPAAQVVVSAGAS